MALTAREIFTLQSRKALGLFGEAPYQMSFAFCKILAAIFIPKAELKARNSFALGYLQPGFSDLDLSLFLPVKFSKFGLRLFLQAHSFARRLLPLFGEMNVYSADSIALLSRLHNPFELKRNPALAHTGRQVQTAHAAAFVLRQLKSDYHNLKKNPEYRMKKWLYHWRQINQSLNLEFTHTPPGNSSELKDWILAFAVELSGIHNPVLHKDMTQQLEFFLELTILRFDFSKAKSLFAAEPWLIAWWPQVFAQWDVKYVKLSAAQLPVFQAQIEWELAGLVTQATLNAGTLCDHVMQLQRLTEAVIEYSGAVPERDWLESTFSLREHFQAEA